MTDLFASPSAVSPEPTPLRTPQGHNVADPFAAPSAIDAGPRKTEFHEFPLPERLRQFETPRDQWGRYLLPNPVTGNTEGGTRTTTLADTLDDRYNLERYQKRMIIHGLKKDPDLLDNVDTLGEWRDVNADVDKVIEKAQLVAGDAYGRELGTAVHEWLEVIDGGKATVDDVPPVFKPKVVAYYAELERAGILPIANMVERIVRNEKSRNTGTFDRIYQLPDGSICIGDVKTAKDLKYSYAAIAAQLASYADAEFLLSEDGSEWVEMPPVRKDYAVVLWVPSPEDRAEIVTIDLDFGRRVLEMAIAVRDMRDAAKKSVHNIWKIPAKPAPEPVVAPTPVVTYAYNGMEQGAYDELVRRIQMGSTQDHMAALWQEYQAYWTPALTDMANAAISAAAQRNQNPWR